MKNYFKVGFCLILLFVVFGFSKVYADDNVTVNLIHGGSAFQVTVPVSGTIKDLKDAIMKVKNIDSDKQMIWYSNQELKDDELLFKYSNGSSEYGYTMHAIFYKKVTEERVINLNSIKPNNVDDLSLIAEEFFETGIGVVSCDESLTNCISKDDTTYYTNTKINYNFDNNVSKVVDNIVKNIPERKSKFEVTDSELINYFYYGGTLTDYSGDFKGYLGYKNFRITVRGGDANSFFTASIGNADFRYNNTVYYMMNQVEIGAKHIFYVPTDTTDIKAAIKSRLKDILGDNNIVVEESNESVNDYLNNEREIFKRNYDPSVFGSQFSNADDYADYWMNINYYNRDAYYQFVGEYVRNNGSSHYYVLYNGDKNDPNTKSIRLLIVKDSSKIIKENKYQTSDVGSNIEISTSSLIPLDTLIQVAKVTTGEEYEKITKILKVSNALIYDLKLFSNAKNQYINKLDNGLFEVRIPITDSFVGKNLVVYYVTDDNKIEEHEVTVKDGYAIFKTNHFSIYTLAEKNDTVVPSNTNSTIESPKTFDSISIWAGVLLISILGVTGSAIYLNKYKKNF